MKTFTVAAAIGAASISASTIAPAFAQGDAAPRSGPHAMPGMASPSGVSAG